MSSKGLKTVNGEPLAGSQMYRVALEMIDPDSELYVGPRNVSVVRWGLQSLIREARERRDGIVNTGSGTICVPPAG